MSREAGAVEYDAKAAAEQIIEWLQSPKGQAVLRRNAKKTEEFIAELRKCRQIPWEKLHAPFTI